MHTQTHFTAFVIAVHVKTALGRCTQLVQDVLGFKAGGPVIAQGMGIVEVQLPVGVFVHIRLAQYTHFPNLGTIDMVDQRAFLTVGIVVAQLEVEDVIRLALQGARGIGDNTGILRADMDLGIDECQVGGNEPVVQPVVDEPQPAERIQFDTLGRGILGIDE